MPPKTPTKPTTKTLLLRLCNHSFQSTGKEDLSPPVPFNVEDYPNLDTEEGWNVFEKAICVAFDVRYWAHRPVIHQFGDCEKGVGVGELRGGKFSFEKGYLVCFRRREEWAGMENDEPDWEADPAREFLEEFDREMKVKRQEERRRIREMEVAREMEQRREMEIRRRLWQNQRILQEWDEKQMEGRKG